jgi:exodeoxyribonuclease V alpha subunit
MLLQRNLLYTGITRAKQLVVSIGTKKALGMAIRNNKIIQRYTGLAQRIKDSCNSSTQYRVDFDDRGQYMLFDF